MPRPSACDDPALWPRAVYAWFERQVDRATKESASSRKQKRAADLSSQDGGTCLRARIEQEVEKKLGFVGEVSMDQMRAVLSAVPPRFLRGCHPPVPFLIEVQAETERGAPSPASDMARREVALYRALARKGSPAHAWVMVAYFFVATMGGTILDNPRIIDARVRRYLERARLRYCKDPKRDIPKALGLGHPGPGKPAGAGDELIADFVRAERDDGSSSEQAHEDAAVHFGKSVRSAQNATEKHRGSRAEPSATDCLLAWASVPEVGPIAPAFASLPVGTRTKYGADVGAIERIARNAQAKLRAEIGAEIQRARDAGASERQALAAAAKKRGVRVKRLREFLRTTAVDRKPKRK